MLRKRALGATGLEVSEIGLGTWGLGGAYGALAESVGRATIEAALEAGVTTFDCAPLWGRGAVESWVGEVVKDKRDQVQLVTRGGAIWDDEGVHHRFTSEALRADCEGSLKRLQTDRIDVFLLHDPAEEMLYRDDTVPTVKALKSEGKVRAWGVSTTDVSVARMALSRGAEVLCLPYNLIWSGLVHELETELSLSKVGLLARSPLMHGLLSGRWTEYRQFADDDHRRARWTHKALTVRVREVNPLRFLVKDEVRSMTSAAMRYVLASSAVSCALLGARRPVQIANVVDLAGTAPYLPPEDLERVAQLVKP
ncbi:MAG: aldo/keto reductase [Polyangiales bacterium]